MLTLLFGGVILGIIWSLIFWVGSLFVYLFAWICSLCGIFVDISGERNVWLLFCIVTLISIGAANIPEDASTGWGIFVFLFLTGSFSLFRSADVWKIGSY